MCFIFTQKIQSPRSSTSLQEWKMKTTSTIWCMNIDHHNTHHHESIDLSFCRLFAPSRKTTRHRTHHRSCHLARIVYRWSGYNRSQQVQGTTSRKTLHADWSMTHHRSHEYQDIIYESYIRMNHLTWWLVHEHRARSTQSDYILDPRHCHYSLVCSCIQCCELFRWSTRTHRWICSH